MKSFIVLFFVSITASAAVPLAPVALTNAPYQQTPFDVASNGTDFVTIWSDQRSGLDLFQSARPAALYSSRLNADGTTAAPAGHRLAPLSYFAKLTRNGAGYLVVWTDFTKSYAMPLDADGVPAAAPSVLANVGSPLALASNGSNFLLLYTDNAGSHAAILAPDGTLARTTALASDRQVSPIWVLPDGSYQFVAFQVKCTNLVCATTAALTTVASSGAVTEQKLSDLPGSSQIAAAYGNGHIVVANLSTSQSGRFVEYRLFDGSSAAQLGSTVQVAADASFCNCGDGSISAGWDGSEFLIAYQWPDLRAARVSSDGVLLDATPIVLDPAGGTAPVFASNGATTAVVWGSGTLYADVVSRSVRSFDDLAAAPVHLVSQSAALERRVQLAGGPNGPLAVWRARYPNPAIAGGIVGSPATTIAPANQFDLQTPEAARGRDAFLVVWREQQLDPFGQDKSFRIIGRRVSFFGVPLDAPFTIASSTLPIFTSGEPSIAVASDGTNWFVVFPDDQLTVRGVRVSADGAVLDAKPITLSLGPPHFGIPASPHVVWNGSRYIVVWAEDPHNPAILSPPGPPSSQLYETRVTAAGEVVDTKQIWDGGFVPDIALAAGTDRLLLAWVENEANLYDMVLDSDGTPLTSPRIIAAPPHLLIADVEAAWDGASFATAWTARTYLDATAVYEHVDANGLPIESAPLDVAPELPTKYTPSLAPSAGGVTIAFEATGETEVSRAFATTIGQVGQPPRRRAAR